MRHLFSARPAGYSRITSSANLGKINIAAAHHADDRAGPAFAAEASCYCTGTRAFADDAISLRYKAHGVACLLE